MDPIKCGIWERFRRHYRPLQSRNEVKLDGDDITRICRLVVDHELNTQYVADRYDISLRRVQQLAKEYRETGQIPTIETPGRNPYARYPPDLIERDLELYELHDRVRPPSHTSCANETGSRSTTIASTKFSRSTTT